MIKFADAIRQLGTAENAEPAERLMHWRRILMELHAQSFADGYSAALEDNAVRPLLRAGGRPAPPWQQSPDMDRAAVPHVNGHGGPVSTTHTAES